MYEELNAPLSVITETLHTLIKPAATYEAP